MHFELKYGLWVVSFSTLPFTISHQTKPFEEAPTVPFLIQKIILPFWPKNFIYPTDIPHSIGLQGSLSTNHSSHQSNKLQSSATIGLCFPLWTGHIASPHNTHTHTLMHWHGDCSKVVVVEIEIKAQLLDISECGELRD